MAEGKKNRKYGRNLNKCKLYRASKTREKNKIKRILQSNGLRAAIEYGKKHGIHVPGQERARERAQEADGVQA